MLTISPDLRLAIAGITAFAMRKAENVLVSKVRLNWSIETSMRGPAVRYMK
jgi:hypothetical protein